MFAFACWVTLLITLLIVIIDESPNKQLRALRVYCGSQCERMGVSRQQEFEASVTLHLQPGSMSFTFEILFGNSAHEMVLPTLRNYFLPQLIRSG